MRYCGVGKRMTNIGDFWGAPNQPTRPSVAGIVFGVELSSGQHLASRGMQQLEDSWRTQSTKYERHSTPYAYCQSSPMHHQCGGPAITGNERRTKTARTDALEPSCQYSLYDTYTCYSSGVRYFPTHATAQLSSGSTTRVRIEPTNPIHGHLPIDLQ